MYCGEVARLRLIEKNRMEEETYKENLERIIKETMKENALKAMNLNQLLKKKWSEEKNAYMIMSKIQTET